MCLIKQVDLNLGKRTAKLDLRDEGDRAKFEKLLEVVDVVVDGYRAGALES
jgi:crotonobetainyl-CoA:carnitine CoA-transferase CaiB-like acyl-CoA transferase